MFSKVPQIGGRRACSSINIYFAVVSLQNFVDHSHRLNLKRFYSFESKLIIC